VPPGAPARGCAGDGAPARQPGRREPVRRAAGRQPPPRCHRDHGRARRARRPGPAHAPAPARCWADPRAPAARRPARGRAARPPAPCRPGAPPGPRRAVEAELREPPARARGAPGREQVAHPGGVLRGHEVQRAAHEPGPHEVGVRDRRGGHRGAAGAERQRVRALVLRLHSAEVAHDLLRAHAPGPVQQLRGRAQRADATARSGGGAPAHGAPGPARTAGRRAAGTPARWRPRASRTPTWR
jgi:hypothetical protein